MKGKPNLQISYPSPEERRQAIEAAGCMNGQFLTGENWRGQPKRLKARRLADTARNPDA
jgi:hypothetical protein